MTGDFPPDNLRVKITGGFADKGVAYHWFSDGSCEVVPADAADVRRSEFDALKREVDALKTGDGQPLRTKLKNLVDGFRGFAWESAHAEVSAKTAGDDETAKRCSARLKVWTSVIDDLEALLKTTE